MPKKPNNRKAPPFPKDSDGNPTHFAAPPDELPPVGVVYVASGAAFQREAAISARSVAKYDPALPITIRTSHPDELAGSTLPDSVTIEPIERVRGLWSKPLYIPPLPYRRTLFLDTDTLVVHKDAFLPFMILPARYAFALAHSPARGYSYLRGVPNCVPVFNSGVVFINGQHPATFPVLRAWRRAYQRRRNTPRVSDQAILSRILWDKKAPVYTLPPEWNCRGWRSGVAGVGQLRIVHNRQAIKDQRLGRFKRRFATSGGHY